ncbi:hypothetical protein CALCODRAFT_544010 [Calocera cornea HHB12733]|uniref:Uncharacterized protein n=1 Tax=Calocera cornea HHB12733 TaxID=1353952 RepID=A0A165F7N1_9BASI|nr:hypothetical protein CALCODRAFT_544010 [Calocera cornea HHB12733]
MPKKKGGGGILSTWSAREFNIPKDKERVIGPNTDLAAHGRASPERAMDDLVRGELNVVSESSSVEQRYHPTKLALRLWKSSVTSIVTTTVDAASSAAPDASIASNTVDTASSAVSVGQRYHPTDSDFASRLRSGPDASIASTPASAASSAVPVGQRYHPTTADRLRIGPDTTTVSTPTSDFASSADAEHNHPSTPQISIQPSANTEEAEGQSSPPSLAAPASNSAVVVENDNIVVGAVVDPELAHGGASTDPTEPDFDPPAYEDRDTPQGAGAYESRVSTPVLETLRLEDDTDHDEPLPAYRRSPKPLLPPLYSPPRKRRAAAAVPAAAVPAAAVPAAAGPAAAVPAPPQRSIADMSFEELELMIKENSRKKFNTCMAKYHMQPLASVNQNANIASSSRIVAGRA